MDRDHRFRLDQLPYGVSGLFRPHGEKAPDAHEREVRLVELPNERHIAEDGGVSRVIDLEAVLHLDHVANGDPGSSALSDGGGVVGVPDAQNIVVER